MTDTWDVGYVHSDLDTEIGVSQVSYWAGTKWDDAPGIPGATLTVSGILPAPEPITPDEFEKVYAYFCHYIWEE